MKLFWTAPWYVDPILRYGRQMLPCMLLGLAIGVLLRPMRSKRLSGRGLVSPVAREISLLLFLIISAGLAALTLFPANLWEYVYEFLFHHQVWQETLRGRSWLDYYPPLEVSLSNLQHLPDMIVPFQEIRRALRHMNPWLLLMLLGNIFMFIPVGFFTTLLWRGWNWWKILLLGASCSIGIESIQLFIGRITDVDDVILNTTGVMVGFWLACLFRVLSPELASQFQCRPKGVSLWITQMR